MKKNSIMAQGSDDRSIQIAASDFEEEGLEVQSLRPFGVGLDVHRLFIQVSVIVKKDNRYYEYQKEFKTTWDDVCKAKEWVISTIEAKSVPPVKIDDSVPFRYCLESTGQYHEIVLRSWLGEPELINPLLAGATLKKTDYLINNDVTSTSGKNKKAQELGIPILSEEAFLELAGAEHAD